MKELLTQDMFETMWFHNVDSKALEDCREDHSWIVYFTAAWCGPCKKLDLEALDAVAKSRNLTIWKCDATVNEYTIGYCGIRSFPTFAHFRPKQIQGQIQSNDTQTVQRWLEQQ